MKTISNNNKIIEFPSGFTFNDCERDDFDKMISSAFSYMDDDILDSLMDDIADDSPQSRHTSIMTNEEIKKIYDRIWKMVAEHYNNYGQEKELHKESLINIAHIPKNNYDWYFEYNMPGRSDSTKKFLSCSDLEFRAYLPIDRTYFSPQIQPMTVKALEMKHSLRDLHRDNFGFALYWKRLIAKCDGNSYAITSCNSIGYINISAINNSFICVPEKMGKPFGIADLVIENKNIDSITIPDSIRDVRLKITSCSQLLSISFLDFFIGNIIRKSMNLCIDISDCRNLQYIQFPKRKMIFIRLQIKDCVSLKKVHFPGDIANIENIFIDKSTCPNLRLVSNNKHIKDYAEKLNIPIEEDCVVS